MGRGFQRLDSNTDFRLETNSRGALLRRPVVPGWGPPGSLRVSEPRRPSAAQAADRLAFGDDLGHGAGGVGAQAKFADVKQRVHDGADEVAHAGPGCRPARRRWRSIGR